MRRITTSGRDFPANTEAIINDFFKTCQSLSPDGFGKESIINMDETSISLDFPSKVTYERKGTKRVKSVTTGGGRVRLSAAFSTTASGEKLPILILVPRKTPLPDNSFIGGKPPSNVYLIYKPSATFDETVVCKYLDNIVQPYMTGNMAI